MSDRMWLWLYNFCEQLRRAAELGADWELTSTPKPRSIAFIGIGGSAIGATLISDLYRDQLTCPVVVSRGSRPPRWLGEGHLAVAVSYSGNTAETLAAFTEAKEHGADVVSISSGGKLAEIAADYGTPHLVIPPGFAPRAALGYTSIPLIHLLKKTGTAQDLSTDIEPVINAVQKLRADWSDSTGAGAGIARRLLRRFPIIVGAGLTAGITRRFQAQLAENAKALSLTFAVPEALHNLLETLQRHDLETLRSIVVYLENPDDSEDVKNYLYAARQAFRDAGVEGIVIPAQGNSDLVRMYTLIHKIDWISYHLAKLRGMDPVPIPLIQRTKEQLQKKQPPK